MTFFLRSSLLLIGFLALRVPPSLVADPAAANPPPAVKPPPPLKPPLYRDTTIYPPLQLTWNQNTDLSQMLHVFPHPLLPQVAVATTQTGVFQTADAGSTWTELPDAAAAKVGVIDSVAFHPVAPGTFYLASQTNGIWVTTDDGKTFRQVAGKSKGMASDTVDDMIIYPGDPSHRTLLTVHGDAALGISRSRDGGDTWDVLDTDYHFSRIFGADGTRTQIYLFGSTTKEPDIHSAFTCHTVGEYLVEVVRDVVPTDLVFAPVPWKLAGFTYLATSDSGIYRIDNASYTGVAYDVKQLQYPSVDGWASVGATWGPSADSCNLFLYDPTKMGLVAVPQDLANKSGPGDDLASGVTASDGLPDSPLTKEGANLHPNANGTAFYAVTNGALYIGRSPADVPVVSLTPPAFAVNSEDEANWRRLGEAFQTFSYAKGSTLDAATSLTQGEGDLLALYNACQLTVTARVPLQPSPPKSVTVDLSRYGGDPHTVLDGDGRPEDGAPNDGLYGLTFAFRPNQFPVRDQVEWRSRGPGRVALGVVATYADGKCCGAVGVLNVLKKFADISLWNEGIGSAGGTVEGGVTAEPFLNPLAPKQPSYAPRLHQGDVAVRLTVSNGPWAMHFKMAYNRQDIESSVAIAFYLRLDGGAAPKELYLQLRDDPDFSPPTTTEKVAVLNGVTLGPTWQRIIVPMQQVLGTATQFQLDHLDEIIVSGDGSAPATLVMDGLQALATDPKPPVPKPTP